MRQPPKPDPVRESDKGFNDMVALLSDMAGATWRMFVPIVGLLLVGRYFDAQWGTKPFLMLTGALIGAVISWALIKSQLKKGS